MKRVMWGSNRPMCFDTMGDSYKQKQRCIGDGDDAANPQAICEIKSWDPSKMIDSRSDWNRNTGSLGVIESAKCTL